MSFTCSSCRQAAHRLFTRFNAALTLSASRPDIIWRRSVAEGTRYYHCVRSQCQSHCSYVKRNNINKDFQFPLQTAHLYTSSTPLRSAEDSVAQKPQQQRPVAPQSTIDDEEVRKFSSLAELWWDEAGEFEALHSMNELRVPLIRDALTTQRQLITGQTVKPSRPLEGFRIVDVGSGGGILSEPLARLGANVIGVDASEENIKTAQAHVKYEPKVARNIKYIQSTVEDLAAEEAGKFDAVIASEVVEHVADVPTFVTACCQLVKPGGSVFLTTLNKTYLSYTLGVVAAENVLRLVSPGTHDWDKFVSPQDLQYILDQNEFSTRLLHGMMYNPLTKRWSWMKNTYVNYAIHAIRANDSAAQTDTQS